MAIHKVKSHSIICDKTARSINNPIAMVIWVNVQILKDGQELDAEIIKAKYGFSNKDFNQAISELVCMKAIRQVDF